MSPVGPARAPRPWLAVSTAGLIGLPLLAELVLRTADFRHPPLVERFPLWSAERDAELRSGEGLHVLDADLLWKPRPGALLPWTNGERVNPDGYRGPQLEIAHTPKVLRIAVLGGSGSFGVGVRWEDTYSARLVQLLRERGIESEVLCAAVPEHSARQGLERWRSLVQAYRPNLVISTFVGTMGFQHAYGSMSDGQKMEFLRSQPESTHTGSSPRSTLRLLHMAAWLGDMCGGDFWSEREAQFEERRIAVGDGSLDWPGVRRVPTNEFEECLDHLFEETRGAGARLFVVSIPKRAFAVPSPAQIVYDDVLANWAERRRVVRLDLNEAFKAALQSAEIAQDDLYTSEGLPSECAHLEIAKSLASEIAMRVERMRSK